MDTSQVHINIFIAYSRTDVKYLERLEVHLQTLKHKYKKLNIWYDGEIIQEKNGQKQLKNIYWKRILF